MEARKYFVEPHIIDFADFPTYRGKKVLDVGCGIGTIGSGFSRCGADYTGFELSEKSLEIAKKRFQVLGHSGRFIHGNAEELASYFPDDTFDLIFSFGVIHHSPDPKKIVREMRKILSPNGEIKIMVYAKNSWKQTMIDAGFDQPEAQSGCPIAFSYSKEEINDLLEGFDILSIEQDHIFPYMVNEYKQYRYVKEPWFAQMPEEMFKALEKSFGWHLCITAKPSKPASERSPPK